MATRVKVPLQVLARAKAAAVASSSRKQAPSEPAKSKKPTARAKIVRALQKLHPMD